MFYQVNQNNSGGKFTVTDKLCNILIIEANSERDATNIATELGCYFNGVDEGFDCNCCGDRWEYPYEINLNEYTAYPVYLHPHVKDTEKVWFEMYKNYEIVEQPSWKKCGKSDKDAYFIGSLRLRNIKEYGQLMSDMYGHTTPNCRIYYKNGNIDTLYMKSYLLA